MYYAYVIKSKRTGKFYYGSTLNIERRLKEHNRGKNIYTKSQIPWELIYFEEFSARSEAMKREGFFKSGQGREYIKRNIKR